MNLFEEAKYIHNNKRLTESVIFHEVESDEVEDVSDWAILDNDRWFADGDGLLLEENRTYRELIFSKNHETAIHRALEDFEGEELLEELRRITGLEYVEDELSDYPGGWQKIYYPKGAFTQEEIDWFSDAYFGNYTAYATVDDSVDPQYIWVFDSDKRRPEEIIAADTGLPVSEVAIKKIKGYKQVPIYED